MKDSHTLSMEVLMEHKFPAEELEILKKTQTIIQNQ